MLKIVNVFFYFLKFLTCPSWIGFRRLYGTLRRDSHQATGTGFIIPILLLPGQDGQ